MNKRAVQQLHGAHITINGVLKDSSANELGSRASSNTLQRIERCSALSMAARGSHPVGQYGGGRRRLLFVLFFHCCPQAEGVEL